MKMKRNISIWGALLVMVTALAVSAGAQNISRDRDIDYTGRIRPDRYLDVEVWTNDNEYYEGDDITISFRANRDCFVAIYNIDTRGTVNLLYPTEPGDPGHIQGGKTYRLPDRYDSYQLTVQGPTGTEYLRIVGSREPLRIPDWYSGSDLVCDDDPYDFMDYIAASYFDCDGDCPRSTDMTSFRVREWHQYYFRPVHIYDYPDWSLSGSVYIDYPFGATIYIDGIYWGVAPLFIPRIFWGYHYISIYDHYGYCWEDRINVVRYKSVIIDENIVRTKPGIKSRYREVQRRGYLDPARNGYPEYQKEVRVKETYKPVSKTGLDFTSGKKTRTDSNRNPGYYDKPEGKKQTDSYNLHKTTKQSEATDSQVRPGKRGSESTRDTYQKQGKQSTPKPAEKGSSVGGKRQTGSARGGEVKVSSGQKSAPKESTGDSGTKNTSDDGSKKRR